jgi:hypothetical protein
MVTRYRSPLAHPGSPPATLSSSNLGFSYHQIRSKSLAQKVTLTSGGEVPLVVSRFTTGNPGFTESNNRGTSVKAGQSCVIRVFFHPRQPFSETGTLTITDNGTNSPQTAPLTGIGTIAPIVVYPIMAHFRKSGTQPHPARRFGQRRQPDARQSGDHDVSECVYGDE